MGSEWGNLRCKYKMETMKSQFSLVNNNEVGGGGELRQMIFSNCLSRCHCGPSAVTLDLLPLSCSAHQKAVSHGPSTYK